MPAKLDVNVMQTQFGESCLLDKIAYMFYDARVRGRASDRAIAVAETPPGDRPSEDFRRPKRVRCFHTFTAVHRLTSRVSPQPFGYRFVPLRFSGAS
jgi:hypothetical protein